MYILKTFPVYTCLYFYSQHFSPLIFTFVHHLTQALHILVVVVVKLFQKVAAVTFGYNRVSPVEPSTCHNGL